MEAMVARSLDGIVDLDFASSGVTWRLTCPAANALEQRQLRQNSGGATEKSNDRTASKFEVQTTA